ncbi:MAG: HEPN domain-containing protein [Chloroflexi bacterium]|nr:HEPN domain-containing protein [Chloroflexota bacterium]
MPTVQQLRGLAQARLRDAEILFDNGRYDGAVYLGGYAIELLLKARICVRNRWKQFPERSAEFDSTNERYRTHDLSVLLRGSGRENRIRARCLPEWYLVSRWNPEQRYDPSSHVSRREANEALSAIKTLKGQL